MSYIKIYEDATKFPSFEIVELPEELNAWLNACYKLLNCNSIEIVPSVLRGIVLVIDEEGKLKDGWLSRTNQIATQLYRNSHYDVITGDAILARVDGEKLVPLTTEDIKRLKKFYTF